ncbi:uncharacterized protein EV422DRAFT_525832 [Fimicolochytrium jonesii]|uniref:uncharacterized protein n=1 Tax=Fimicolochytrium jonesii TaxID=1396493 RepID=UPI0022FE698D|nr:uncharacterized protein EV422DRAFT_525832 [Fimicolochytrium jonesii]KAI8822139.1 hypothetical protein EV422DRAFT_525832 [Fimicolochytrium jonesii]
MLLKDDISRTEPLENSILGQSLGLHRRLNLKAPLDVFEEILEETDPKGTITVEIGEWISEISSLSKSGQFDLLTYWREVCSMFNRIDDTAAFLMIESIEPATARFAISDILLSRLSYVSRKSNGQTRLSASNFPTKARKHLEAVPIDQNWEAYITLITIILGTIDVELNEDTKRALHDGVEFIRDRAPKKAKVHTQTLVDFVDLIWPTA